MAAVHVFSDASFGKFGWSGAYIVGNGEPIGIYVQASSSTEAELKVSAEAVHHARELHRTEDIIAHTDLAGIHQILFTLRSRGALLLKEALEDCRAWIVADANNHKEHRRCHHHARVTAGIKGTKHPKLPKVKQLTLRFNTRQKFIAVIEALKNNPMGTTETRLAQESGIGLNATHKILRQLQGHCKVRCEIPEGVDGCDLAKWKWFTQPTFGTLLGELLAEAGVR